MRFCTLFLLFLISFLFSLGHIGFAQEVAEKAKSVESSSAAERSFEQLRTNLTALQETKVESVSANPMVLEQERSKSIESWVKQNAWQELPFSEQAWLCDKMSSPDQLDKGSFSVRWTGTLRVPANGSYKFTQFEAPGAEGNMRLWLDNILVMDTTQKTLPVSVKEEIAEETMVLQEESIEVADETLDSISSAVPLTAGKAIDFKLEFVREPRVDVPGVFKLSGYPAAVLLWESDVVEQQVVPSSAFSLPGTFSKQDQAGLRGEYFSDTAFTNKVASRLDPSIDFIWDTGAVCTEYRDVQREILSANIGKITSPGFLTTMETVDAENFVKNQLPTLLPLMTASERVATMTAIADQPELLKHFSFVQMTGALRWFSLLPDESISTDFLVRWSETAPQPRMKPGFYPGRGNGGYLSTNIEPYFRLATQFLGKIDVKNQRLEDLKVSDEGGTEKENAKTPLPPAIEELASHLANPDGTCNLTVAYVLCCICRMSGHQQVVMDRLDEQILNEELPADTKVSWLIAEAFKLETVFDYDFRPGNGMISLEKALEITENPDLRFQVIQEMAARLIAMDRADEAKSLVLSVQDQFATESKQSEMDQILTSADEVTTYYETIRAQRDTRPETTELYVKELARRAEVAQTQGDTASAERYQSSVTAYEQFKAQEQNSSDTSKQQ